MKNETMLFLIAVVAIVVMGILIALGILFPAGLSQNSGETYLTLSGTGTATAAPQLAVLSVVMNGTGSSSAVATSNLSLTLNEFNSSISPYLSGNSSSITTQQYSVYKYNTSAYVATEYVSVNLPNVLNVSSIIGSLSLIRNVYVQGISTQLSDAQANSLTQQALTAAIANATEQASTLAPNQTLTIRNITISGAYRYPYPFSVASAAAPGQNPIFFTGKESVTETATVVFSYK